MKQFEPQYFVLAYPFTLPIAVSSYDIPRRPRRRRPDASKFGKAEDDEIAASQPKINWAQ